MILTVFIWLATLICYTVAFNDTCRDILCTCCSDGRCTLSADNQYVCRSCIDGYTGRQCEEPCPENCFNCSQTFYTSERICFACQNGYYKGRYKDITEYPIQNDCSLSCTTGCESCTSYHSCNRCEIGYFPSSEKQCIKCLTNCAKCSNTTKCEQCKDGYFVKNDYCRQCQQQNCKTCISSQQCSVCELGYYLEGKGCKQCHKEGCLGCISLDTCSSCLKGYYLTNGQCLTCGSNCIDCTLNSDSQVVCNECQNGYYIYNGTCSNCGIGCNVCKSKTNCVICEHGYQLHKGVCIKCPLNCILCESNNYCNTCQVGYYVNEGQCNACHESCTSCSSMEQCLTCADGFYGSKCSYPCNKNCYSNQCDKITGVCLSCGKGYYLKNNTQCVSCPEHCIVCKSPSTCMVCEDGYKGETCQEACSNCNEGTRCEKSNGYCFEECREGLSGPNCDLTCDQKCSRCTRGNLNECQTCAYDRYGVSCTKQCSQNCLNGSCHGIDGVCRYGCLAGYWGPICEHNCSSNCSLKTCDRVSGFCMFQDKEHSKETSSTRVGIIVGVVVFVVVIACIVFLYRLRVWRIWSSRRKTGYSVEDPTKGNPDFKFQKERLLMSSINKIPAKKPSAEKINDTIKDNDYVDTDSDETLDLGDELKITLENHKNKANNTEYTSLQSNSTENINQNESSDSSNIQTDQSRSNLPTEETYLNIDENWINEDKAETVPEHKSRNNQADKMFDNQIEENQKKHQVTQPSEEITDNVQILFTTTADPEEISLEKQSTASGHDGNPPEESQRKDIVDETVVNSGDIKRLIPEHEECVDNHCHNNNRAPEQKPPRVEDTVHAVFPFKPPDVENVFYEVDKSSPNKSDSDTDTSIEENIVEIKVIPRSYSELESHYTEEPISQINPSNPPAVTYNATWITEGWEKGTKGPDSKPPDFTVTNKTKRSVETKNESESKEIEISIIKPASESSHKVEEEPTNVSEPPESPVGLVGELAAMSINASSGPAPLVPDHQRKINWERGQIDYLGQDSFENIQRKIDETLQTESAPAVPVISSPFVKPNTTEVAERPALPVVEPARKDVVEVSPKSTSVKVTSVSKVTSPPATQSKPEESPKPTEPKKTTAVNISLSSKKK